MCLREYYVVKLNLYKLPNSLVFLPQKIGMNKNSPVGVVSKFSRSVKSIHITFKATRRKATIKMKNSNVFAHVKRRQDIHGGMRFVWHDVNAI